jgi:hypothetical protein
LAALAQPLRCNAERLSPVPKWGDGDLQQGNHLKIDGRMYFNGKSLAKLRILK